MISIIPTTSQNTRLQIVGDISRFAPPLKKLETPDEGVAMFIDSSNLFFSCKKLGIRHDLNVYLTLKERFGADKVFVYMSLNPASESEKLLIRALRRNKFRVWVKPIIQRPDGTKKGNLDVEMALSVMEQSSLYDRIVLLSGDGDFCILVRRLRQQDKHVTVVGLNYMTSPLLKRQANRYIDLESIFRREAS